MGAQLQETLNETRAKSLGKETETGLGEWLFDWNPYFNIRWMKKQNSFAFIYNGRSSRPSAARQMPVLDIAVPTRLQMGNIYLKPSYSHSAVGSIYLNNPQKQHNLNLYLTSSLIQRQTVTASWFDDDGIQYSVPVNSAKPAVSVSVFLNGRIALTPDKKLSLRTGFSATDSRSISYQNTRRLEGLDVETFDYSRFMEGFWGDESGSRFYSGQSGFSESVTNSLSLSPDVGLSYRGESLTVSLFASTNYRSAHYSLDSSADTRTWSNNVYFEGAWSSKNGWELSTEVEYNFFKGFPAGYNEPYLLWNFGVNRSIKQFTIGFYANDILNSTRSTRHITTDNYIEDSMYNQLGRHFFITFKWNFGKLNATQSQKANRAAMNMMF